MDKQMIEEMAKLVQGDMCGDVPCEECNYHGKMKILPRYCGVYLIAEKLYNAGYRKIPENAVVLTEEESVKAWKNGNCNAHAIYGLAYEQARKETAEKFAENVNQTINAYRKKVGEDEYVVDARRLIFEVNEICKEFTRREK